MRKLISVLLLTALVCPIGAAQTYSAYLSSWDHPAFNILFDDSGRLMMFFEGECEIQRIAEEHEWFSRQMGEQYALVNADGRQVSDTLYEGFHTATENSIVFCETKNGQTLFGLIDGDGNEIFPAQFGVLEKFGGNHLFTVDDQGYVTIIGEDGRLTPTPYKKAANISGWGGEYAGTAAELLPVVDPEVDLVGYIDPIGEWAIPPQFSRAGDFSEASRKYAIFYGEGNKIGLIDQTGKIVIPAEYKALHYTDISYIDAKRTSTSYDMYTPEGGFICTHSGNLSLCGDGCFYDSAQNALLDADGNPLSIDLSGYSPEDFSLETDPTSPAKLLQFRNDSTKDWHLFTAELKLTESGYETIHFGMHANGGSVYIARKTFALHNVVPEDGLYPSITYCTLLDQHGNELVSFNKQIISMQPIDGSEYFVFATKATIGVIDISGSILWEEPLPVSIEK